MSGDRIVAERFVESLNRMVAEALGVKGTRTYLHGGTYIEQTRGNPYNYFLLGRTQTMFCWTVVPDNLGNYWSWVYVPVGRGARTGKARRWRIKHFVRARHRKTAKARAYRRYLKARGLGVIAATPPPAENAATLH